MATEETFDLECKTLTGDVIHVTASGSMTVKELKERIAEAKEYGADSVRVMKGRTMLKKDTESIANYGIIGPCKLKVIIRFNQVIPTEEIVHNPSDVWNVDISGDDHITAVGYRSGGFRLTKTTTGVVTFEHIYSDSNTNVRFSKDGQYLIAAGSRTIVSKKIYKHDKRGQLELLFEIDFQNGDGGVWTIDVNKDNTMFALAGNGGPRVYDLSIGNSICALNLSRVNSTRFFHSKNWMVSVTQRGVIQIYDVDETKEVSKITTAHNTGNIWIVAVSQNDKFLFTGAHDRCVRQWDVETMDNIKTWTFPEQIYGLYMLKHDEFFLTLETGRGFLVKVDAENKIDENQKIFNTSNRSIRKIAVSNLKNAFIAYTNDAQLIYHRLSEEEFYGAM